MLDYMIAFALILLILGHALLIRGCFKINETLPTESGYITTEIRSVSSVLDEVADLLNELLNSGSGKPVSTQQPTIIEALVNSFLNPTPMDAEHGDTQKQEEWTVHSADPTTNPLQSIESN